MVILVDFGGVSRSFTSCKWLFAFLYLSLRLGYCALFGDHLAVIGSNFFRPFGIFLLTLVRIVLSVLFFCHLLNSALLGHLFCLSAIFLSFLGLRFRLRSIPGHWSFFGWSFGC